MIAVVDVFGGGELPEIFAIFVALVNKFPSSIILSYE